MLFGLAGTTASASRAEFFEHRSAIVAEIEAATFLRATEIIARPDASGEKAVRWKDETGRAEFALQVRTPGTWHVWIRTAATDHLNNGLFLELNGVRQTAPVGHPMAGTAVLYLRKHASAFSWKPEWQGRDKGRHQGPITINFPTAGLHHLALVARRGERPLVDKLVLTRPRISSARAPHLARGRPEQGIWTRRKPQSDAHRGAGSLGTFDRGFSG
jgi:hypothetical protein